ncbi:MAG: DUF402 domain-containing protein [Malacoplasma sp.]|nr:DUF402 domain-containing protein [Malacoplasma sp.]MDE5949369.1 DUF402 domain-containing protein [Malacoplasma sp.]MDE6893808.1 DUF402 domain-containing protein [Malacoplasma sp.]
MNIKINKKIMIHAYKRNGWLYRVWEFPEVLETNSSFTAVSLVNSKVITNEKFSKRNFISRNMKNSFWFFFPDKWYNIIATITPNNVIAYYINIASPFIYEEEAIKYYDFDLDIKMRNNSSSTYKILDIDEYTENKKKYRYEKEVIYNCEKTLKLFEKQEFRDNIINSISPKMLAFLYSKKRKV